MGSCVCLDQADRLERLLDEHLDDGQREAVEDHVEGCLICQRTLEELAAAREESAGSTASAVGCRGAGPDASFLRSLKDRGPPREPGPREAEPVASGPIDTGRAGSGELEPPPERRRLPTITGFRDRARDRPGGHGYRLRGDRAGPGSSRGAEGVAAHHAPSTAVERFHREARAAAKLHHTNIVSVFGVGEDDGQLYYVMQFIESESLDKVVKRLCRAAAFAEGGGFSTQPALETDQAPPRGSSSASLSTEGSSPVYFRTIARIGRQVAEALEYAHKQGILHRDIKPANLLLDAQGNAWVTDFGLAKAFEGEEGLTQTGDIVGTLRFMAPERFDGRSEPRSDVYALGVTLYELLTRRPLFAESNRTKLIDRMLHEEPVALRQIDGRIPRDLETIVQKAMAKEPEARYVSAAALAEDLRRFLGDEPVLARPVGVVSRLTRWCRRQPRLAAAVGLAASSLVLATFLSITLAWSQYRAAAQLRAEQALTLTEKNRAEENFRDAQQAVDDYLMGVSDDTLLKQQDSIEVRELRKRLLEYALKYYRRFLARQGDDPRLLADLAYAQSRIARIIAETGPRTESVSAFQQAASTWEKVVRENPTDSLARCELAACLGGVAHGKAEIGLDAESLRAFEQSLAILLPLARENVADASIGRQLGAR